MSAPLPHPSAPVEAGEARPGLVLLVDDEPLLLRSLARILRRDGHRTVEATSCTEAAAHWDDPALDLVLLDLVLGGESGLDLLDRLKAQRPEVEVVMMTGHASVESAVGAMRRGAFDYLAKPFDDAHRVRTTVRKALERRRLVQRNRELEEALRGRGTGQGLVGNAPSMRALRRTIAALRHTTSHVLIRGESGTGKELVARALHAASLRAEGPFVPVDCGALPETIIESELFGHEAGAFTGATGAPGLFRMAHRGTLFLDEIGEVPLGVQAKLLRALNDKRIRPVGGTREIPVDLRLLSATHRDLDAMVADGRFRLDLLYRVDVVRVEVPPLRERREDVPLLAHHFLEKHRPPGSPVEGIEDDALEALVASAWPGNVRELENAVESAVALARGRRLRRCDLPAAVRGGAPAAGGAREEVLPLSLEAYERRALQRALDESGGDARAAARRLGVGRSTLYRKLARHGLRTRGADRDPIG